MVSNDDAPVITTETLQYRLDTQNFGKTGGQRSSLTRCAQKYGSFKAELSSTTPNAQAIEKTKSELVREVELCDLELTKLILWQQNLEKQAQRNERIAAEREETIQAMKEKVNESRIVSNKSMEQRNCLSEYESLARVINESHPTSSAILQTQIDEMKTEIATLEKESAEKDEIVKVREAQYQLLIQYMTDLKQSLKEDEQDSEGPQPMDIDNLYGDL